MSHYVVTGGAGFIGSAIVRSLLREGARKVVVIDNLLTGHERNLEEVRHCVDFQSADIRDYEQIAPLLRGASVVFREALFLRCRDPSTSRFRLTTAISTGRSTCCARRMRARPAA
jgi:nucleoside-diphosphate-sugar epimerase